MKAEVPYLLREMEPYENFILSTACDIPQEIPMENVHAFMEAGHNYRIGNCPEPPMRAGSALREPKPLAGQYFEADLFQSRIQHLQIARRHI